MLRNKFHSLGLRRLTSASLTSPVTFALLALTVSGCTSDDNASPRLLGAIGDALPAEPVTAAMTALIVEAEAGENGSDLDVVVDATDDSITYITGGTDNTETPTEASDARISNTEVTFPEAGEYQILLRARIGAEGASDDSFFINSGSADTPNWQVLNGLSGYTVEGFMGYLDGALVASTGGNGDTGVWKWILFEDLRVVVPEGELTQTFSFASRENGLDIDKFAFSIVGDGFTTGYTTVQLDAGEPGVMLLPPTIPDDYEPPADQAPLAVGSAKYLGMVCCGNQRPALENYFNQVTPENAGKWGSVEGTRGEFNWTGVDDALALAEENGFPFRFHVLLWGSQQPAWMAALPPEEQLIAIRNWMEAVNERYGDRIQYLEVVNEFVNQPPQLPNEGEYVEALGGAGESGFDWVITGFEMAREIFPDTVQLMLNEYGVLDSDQLTDTYVQLVQRLQQDNLIDALGVQGHAFSTRRDVQDMVRRLDTLETTGLSVYITEMDIDGPPEQQLIDYQRLFTAFWEHPAVQGITLWGYRNGMWREDTQATLVYANGAEKLALRWLKGYLGETAPVLEGPDTASAAADAEIGTEVAVFTANAADGMEISDDAIVAWGLAEENEDEPIVARSLAFAEGTGRLELVGALPAGTYTVRVYVDVNTVVSNLQELVITVE